MPAGAQVEVVVLVQVMHPGVDDAVSRMRSVSGIGSHAERPDVVYGTRGDSADIRIVCRNGTECGPLNPVIVIRIR